MQFDREKTPERVVHARGITAKGVFEVRREPRLASVVHETATVQYYGRFRCWICWKQRKVAHETCSSL